MIFVSLLLLFVCYKPAESGNGSDNGTENGEKQTLYILAMFSFPDPLNRTSLTPKFADGPDIIPAAYFAVDQINNRSDILRNYNLELIQGNGGCNVTSVAYVSFVSNVFHSGKQVVGIVGPTCSDSTTAISELTNREEISLINVHIASSPPLANRTEFPYAFAHTDTTLVSADATILLMQQNQWRSVALLFDVTSLVFTGLIEAFVNGVERLPGYSITYSSAVFYPDFPATELRNSFARIIIGMVGTEHLCNLLCVMYHERFVYPIYQWVMVGNYFNCNGSISITLERRLYECSTEQQLAALEGILIIPSELPPFNGNTESGLTVDEFSKEYPANFSDAIYDGVWSLALALNNSIDVLEQKNMSLSEYHYGQDNITQIIKEEFYQLDFNGTTGRIKYERSTGSRNYSTYLEQYFVDDLENPKQIGSNELGEWNISDKAVFLPDEFESDYIHVSEFAAAVVLVFTSIVAILVASTHFLTVFYRDYKSVKASSPKLNHFVFIGCYMILFTVLIYTIMETFEISYGAQSAFCNIAVWFIDLGFTLMLGTVCVKTWRLYHIFFLSSNRATKPGRVTTDSFLALIILLLISLDVLVCLIWSAADPLVQETTKKLEVINGDHVIEVRDMCKSKNGFDVVILPLLAIYKVILMACSVCLAFLTRRIILEDFKTKNISFLVYLLSIVCGLGFPIFVITEVGDVDVNIPYVLLCAILNMLVIICLALLFFPPLYPLILRKYHIISGMPVSKLSEDSSRGHSIKRYSIKK